MFGPDTQLVIDALQIGAIAVVVGAAGCWLALRRRQHKSATDQSTASPDNSQAGTLEDRVRVLERIATDRSIDLADEIDALRGTSIQGEKAK
ncbi:hypothetical protein ACRAQ7_07950 [Erythrobacter sp. W53]|uniref:hypothetical protein n=1 Tax=Erythrobacter sp. W53 TaxID=3425947 RepID=UPI003D767226